MKNKNNFYNQENPDLICARWVGLLHPSLRFNTYLIFGYQIFVRVICGDLAELLSE
jgi:hypothetical protein